MSWIFGGKEKKEASKETEKETSAPVAAISIAPLTGDKLTAAIKQLNDGISSLAKVKELVDKHRELLHAPLDEEKRSVVIIAARRGYHEILTYLLSLPELDINYKDKDGDTALHRAASGNEHKSIQLLINHPNVNINCRNEKGYTPLYLASLYGNTDSVKVLLSSPHIDPSIPSKFGETPIQCCCSAMFANKDQKEMVISLIQEKINAGPPLPAPPAKAAASSVPSSSSSISSPAPPKPPVPPSITSPSTTITSPAPATIATSDPSCPTETTSTAADGGDAGKSDDIPALSGKVSSLAIDGGSSDTEAEVKRLRLENQAIADQLNFVTKERDHLKEALQALQNTYDMMLKQETSIRARLGERLEQAVTENEMLKEKLKRLDA